MNSMPRMVGVGRIELPTPAMSTQSAGPESAEIREFPCSEERNGAGISREHRASSPHRHRADPFAEMVAARYPRLAQAYGYGARRA